MNPWILVILTTGILSIVMAGLWLFARRIQNYAIVDVAWSFSFGLVMLIYFSLSGRHGWSSMALTALVFIWSSRLGTHLYGRIAGKPEEGRYKTLREEWKDQLNLKFFLFFQAQGLSVVVLSVPFLFTLYAPDQTMGPFQWAGLVLAVIALSGETIADRQLTRFVENPQNRGKVCKVGLWSWSRHPNYFFESLIWVSFTLFALNAPWGWLSFTSPLIIWYLILNVTGIPPTEEQCLKSRGQAYRAYQQETSAFFPLPPKSDRKLNGDKITQ